MSDTKLTANLPNLTIEIVSRDLPEQRAEAMVITIKASPSFEQVGRVMSQSPIGLAPGLGPFAYLMAPALLPLVAWAKVSETMLNAMTGRQQILPPVDPATGRLKRDGSSAT